MCVCESERIVGRGSPTAAAAAGSPASERSFGVPLAGLCFVIGDGGGRGIRHGRGGES